VRSSRSWPRNPPGGFSEAALLFEDLTPSVDFLNLCLCLARSALTIQDSCKVLQKSLIPLPKGTNRSISGPHIE